MTKILLLFGGSSYEHDISIKSAENICKYLDKKVFEISYCYISKDNIWYRFSGDFNKLSINNLEAINNIINYLKEFDVVLNIIHGATGEDGKLQSLFELFDIKYIGCNSISSLLCMNKELTKLILKEYNIKQTNFLVYTNIKEVKEKLNYPLIIKPSNGGSSIGMTIAHNDKELKKGIKIASTYSKKIIVEEFLDNCLELECSVIKNNNKTYASTIGQIIHTNEFYDYDDKYIKNQSSIVIPAKIDKLASEKIKTIAKKAFNILECNGFARIDFLVNLNNNEIYLNEINTIPGFTEFSMFSKLLEFDNINIKDLFTKLIKETIK